jgi:hypothetical protein
MNERGQRMQTMSTTEELFATIENAKSAVRSAFLDPRHDVERLEEIALIVMNAAARPSSHWIRRKSWGKAVCSGCGFEAEQETRYCPNCGAGMEG